MPDPGPANGPAEPFPEDYPALLATIDQWQAAAHVRHPGVIPCRAGCSACCHGPFDISVADALGVRDAVRALPEELRAEVLDRARAQMEEMRAREPDFQPPYDIGLLGEARFDHLADWLEEDPCPALDEDGSCLIYESRPMICRLIGLGVVTRSGEVLENTCPIQDDYPAYRALPPQPFDLEGWNQAEAGALLIAGARLFGGPGHSGYETTVAGAALLDEA